MVNDVIAKVERVRRRPDSVGSVDCERERPAKRKSLDPGIEVIRAVAEHGADPVPTATTQTLTCNAVNRRNLMASVDPSLSDMQRALRDALHIGTIGRMTRIRTIDEPTNSLEECWETQIFQCELQLFRCEKWAKKTWKVATLLSSCRTPRSARKRSGRPADLTRCAPFEAVAIFCVIAIRNTSLPSRRRMERLRQNLEVQTRGG
jgi:hypothetical protein